MSGDWRVEAACYGMPEEKSDAVFFNDNGNYKTAAAYCFACPVIGNCRRMADSLKISHGFFAGETAEARRARLGINKFGRPINPHNPNIKKKEAA